MIRAGHASEVARARRGLDDPEPEVQAAALGALARCGALAVPDIRRALEVDQPPPLRRRAVVAALSVRGPGSRSVLFAVLTAALDDPDPLVAVGAAWFLGERRVGAAVAALGRMARDHPDVRCREAAVAALGAIGNPAGLTAVLAALDDKPTVRRRASNT